MTGGEFSTAAILGTLVPMGVIIIGLITATIINGIKLRKQRRESEGYVPDEPLGASIKQFFRRKRRESLATDESSLPLTD